MYIIQDGEVLITKRVRHQEKPLATLRNGDFFGEMAILNRQPRSATATVLRETRCLVFDDQMFETMLLNHAQVAVRIIRKLSERLRQTDAMIENLLLRDDYSRITNTVSYLLRQRTNGAPASFRLADIALHAGVTLRNAMHYCGRLAELGIAQLRGEDPHLEILEAERLDRLKRYLEMREEFLSLDVTKSGFPTGEADKSPRVSFF